MSPSLKAGTITYHVPALEKGLDILEALSAAAVPLSLAELSRVLKRSASELFRMVTLLERRGYIVREENSGSYYLSLKLYELAHMHTPVDQLLKASARPMRELARSLRQSCHISVLRSGELVVLAQEESPEKVRISVEVGSRFSPFHTVSGRAVLAYLPQDELLSFLNGSPHYADLDDKERAMLTSHLQEIRTKGYETAENETHVGVRDIAVIVGNPRVGVAAALAVTSLMATRQQAEPDQILQEMTNCARKITQILGFSYDLANGS